MNQEMPNFAMESFKKTGEARKKKLEQKVVEGTDISRAMGTSLEETAQLESRATEVERQATERAAKLENRAGVKANKAAVDVERSERTNIVTSAMEQAEMSQARETIRAEMAARRQRIISEAMEKAAAEEPAERKMA
jgi:hypothetical protein